MTQGGGDLIRVVACVVRRDDAYLVCKRPENKRHGGLWEFPGGKCERDESDLEAARRELQEELGLELLSAGAPLYEFHDSGSPYLIIFLPVEVRGDPICHEHSALLWSTVDDLTHLRLAPTDARFVRELAAS